MWIRLLTSPILRWHRNLIERGCISDQRKGHSGRPSVSEQVVDRVRESFLRSPRKSTRRASRELKVTKGGTLSVCDTIWNCLSLCNCNHQFCKNIPVSFDFITTWNQGVFFVFTLYIASEWTAHVFDSYTPHTWRQRRLKNYVSVKIQDNFLFRASTDFFKEFL